MGYELCVTTRGWQMLGDLVASANQANTVPVVNFSRVAFGQGIRPEGTNPETLNGLIDPVADGTTTKPIVEVFRNEDGSLDKCVVSFVVEYASSKIFDNGLTSPGYITIPFYLSEFAVMTMDMHTNEEFAFLRGDLVGCAMYITPFSQGAVDIRQFQVSIVLSKELNVTLYFVPLAWLTAQDMYDYAQLVCKPEFLLLAQGLVDIHNERPFGPETHPEYWARINSMGDRITNLEDTFGGQGSANFFYDFTSVPGGDPVPIRLIKGVWNQAAARLEW